MYINYERILVLISSEVIDNNKIGNFYLKPV